MRCCLAFALSLIAASYLFNPAQGFAGPVQDAALAGDVETLEHLLDSGEPVDEQGIATPLYFACQRGQFDAAALLVDRGADVNALSKWGTPLHVAARRGSVDIVELLLQNGADPNITGGEYSHTPLHEAAIGGSVGVGELLLEYGANVNARTRWFEPPIHFAQVKERSEFAQLLLDHGAAPVSVEPISTELAGADLEAGRVRAIECSNCHFLTPEQQTNGEVPQIPGPLLWGVVGRAKASLGSFDYSKAMSEVGGIWSYEALNQFLADPTGFIPGTRMFAGYEPDHEVRAALIAYLRTLSDNPEPLP